MAWDSAAQAYLATRAGVHYEAVVIVKPRNLTTDAIETFAYWSSHHDHELTIDGELRTLLPTYGGLRVGNPVYSQGTNIRSLDVSLFGLSEAAKSLLQSYDLRLAAAEVYQLLFTPGMAYVGSNQRWKGQVNTAGQKIGQKGGGAKLDLTITSRMRAGTISRAKTKSDASYAERLVDVGDGPEPDTSMQYASLADAESDKWG